MKNLIVYYSFTRNNEKLANYLKAQLECDMVKIETVKRRTGFSIFLDLVFKRLPSLKPASCDVRDYDHVIFVAPVWVGKIATPLKSFLVRERSNIKQYAYISLCGGGNPQQKVNIRKELSEVLKKEPANVVELWVSDLVSAEKKDKIMGIRVDESRLKVFHQTIENFLQEAPDPAHKLCVAQKILNTPKQVYRL